MSVIQISLVNHVYIKIHCEPGIAYELNDYFTFEVPGAKFMPAYKSKMWDGKIRLFSIISGYLYAGLRLYVERFAKERNYAIEHLTDFSGTEITTEQCEQFFKEISLPEKFVPRDFQVSAFMHGVQNRRVLFLSPTASGKSFIIYLLVRYFCEKTLIIVPTTSLVSQMYSDFSDYGFPSDQFVHKIYSGQEKKSDKPITITTWQSIYKMPKDYFKDYKVVIGDEAHGFKAKSLTSIMTKMEQCEHRFGFTGTLDGTETNQLVLEGLFGPLNTVTTTREMIDGGHASDLSIKAIVLQYPPEERKIVHALDYHGEKDYLLQHPKRNAFIKNLALSLKGNTFLLFQMVEKHGDVLYRMLKDSGRTVYYVSGKVKGDEREQIRRIMETEENAIVVASTGTFSTGINIRNLHNVILSSPTKARVKLLQSIGRGLRLSDNGVDLTVYDITDDLTWKKKRNTTLEHFIKRVEVYAEQQFDYKVYPVPIS